MYICSALFRKCFKGGKTEVPRNKGGGDWQLFSMIYAILIDIRLDKFPRGGEKKASPP